MISVCLCLCITSVFYVNFLYLNVSYLSVYECWSVDSSTVIREKTRGMYRNVVIAFEMDLYTALIKYCTRKRNFFDRIQRPILYKKGKSVVFL